MFSDQLLTTNIQYRQGLHFRKGWQDKWKAMLHGVVDELVDNTNYLHTMQRNFNESRIRRTRLMFANHGWYNWDGNERNLPALETLPRWDSRCNVFFSLALAD